LHIVAERHQLKKSIIYLALHRIDLRSSELCLEWSTRMQEEERKKTHQGIISVRDLEFTYGEGTVSLKVLDVKSWSVRKGEQIAISGPSGSGKSTLLYVLAGLLLPTRGNVQVCGVNLENLSETERDRFRARYVGFIFQNFNLLQGYTALENVLLGMTFSSAGARREEARELLSEMGLEKRLKHYPSQMSLGEQQRVAVARALANHPELILADEPTGSLDPLNTKEVLRLLREACEHHGCTLIVVSHEAEVVETFPVKVDFLKLNDAFDVTGGAR